MFFSSAWWKLLLLTEPSLLHIIDQENVVMNNLSFSAAWCASTKKFPKAVGQVWWGFDQMGLGEGALAHGRRVWNRWSLRSLPSQPMILYWLENLYSSTKLSHIANREEVTPSSSQSFCPNSPFVKGLGSPLAQIRKAKLGTASHWSQPSTVLQPMLPWCKACSVSPVHSVEKETTELGLPWKRHSCIQHAHIIMQSFVVRNETPMFSWSPGCPLCGLGNCYPVFLPFFSLLTFF